MYTGIPILVIDCDCDIYACIRVKKLALLITGVLLLISIPVIIVVGCWYHRMRELGEWKRCGDVLRCLCWGCYSRAEKATTAHQRRRQWASAAGPCPREAIPLRSSKIVRNQNYFSPTQTSLNNAGN